MGVWETMHPYNLKERSCLMALLCETIDLDLDDLGEVYVDAEETIKYLQNVLKSIEAKMIVDGEVIDGLKVVDGRKSRAILDVPYLERHLGREKIYKVTEKLIGIGELEKLLHPDEIQALVHKGVIGYNVGPSKVVPTKK